MSKLRGFAAIGIALLLGGCTVHPPGETAERRAAMVAGKPFEHAIETRAQLPIHPTPDDLVENALLNSGELEQRYWEWRAAIEQIPQDGTQSTNFSLSAATTLARGVVSRDRTVISAFNDPMADIVWPDKLSTAARRALDNAQAAGLRFQKAKLELRMKVLSAYADYALTAELIRLEQANAELLQTVAMVVEARNQSGSAGQAELLKARNELDLSRNDIANMQSQLPALRASINAMLTRNVMEPLAVPSELPSTRLSPLTDEQLLATAQKQNPELAAMAREIQARREGRRLAQLQYMPDFSLSASTDLAGITQSLSGMITVPLLRYQAINAAIAQAEANLKLTEAMRRQTAADLDARLIADVDSVRDADRQLSLLEHTIAPRAVQAVDGVRAAYETGQLSLLELLDSQRSLINIRRLIATLRVAREKRLLEIEAYAAATLRAPSAQPR